ncbi:MAG: cell division protein SepF [Clostridiales bacterium]|jgi:cell division inhibitor SepF|nr:cell division protein SepF [Clostridiales bacterium]
MGFFDAAKKMMGLDFDDDDFEIDQDEIDLERKKLEDKPAFEEPGTPLKIDPVMTGINTKVDKPYEVVAPLMSPSMKVPETTVKQSYNGSGQFKMIVIEPKSFEECIKLVDNLKARKPVIVNLEKVESVLANKMFNFLSGSTYALDGTAQKITQNIVIFSPANVNVSAQVNREYTNAAPVAKAREEENPWG